MYLHVGLDCPGPAHNFNATLCVFWPTIPTTLYLLQQFNKVVEINKHSSKNSIEFFNFFFFLISQTVAAAALRERKSEILLV